MIRYATNGSLIGTSTVVTVYYDYFPVGDSDSGFYGALSSEISDTDEPGSIAGTEAANNGSAPNNGPTWKQKNQNCLNQINNTPDGKFYNTFSYASPLFSLADAASEGAKYGVKSRLKAGAKNCGGTALGSGSGFVAGAWEAVDYALAPLSWAATVGQLTVHAGCAIAAAF